MRTDGNYDTDTHEQLFDISLVSACVTKGLKIEAYNRDPKYYPRVGFVFKKGRLLEQTIKDYLNGDLVVDPKTFFENVKSLKASAKMNY